MQLIRTQEVSISSQQETKYMERVTPDGTRGFPMRKLGEKRGGEKGGNSELV